LELFNEQLDLAVSQNLEIKRSVHAGARSGLDMALSDAEVLRRKKQISVGQIAVIEAIENINVLTDGLINIVDGDDGKYKMENDLAALEQSQDLLDRFIKNAALNFDEKNPSFLSLELLSQSYEFLAKAQGALNYPQINVFAKSSLDYPNGPVLESVHQNKAGADFSMPIYQAKGNRNLKNQYKNLAASNKEKAAQARADLKRQFHYLKEKTRLLLSQIELNKEIVVKNKNAAEIVRKSYQAGNAKFLDVLDMDLRVLQAQADEALAISQVLIHLALLGTMGK
jgi:outer membrane protein TolC